MFKEVAMIDIQMTSKALSELKQMDMPKGYGLRIDAELTGG